MADGGSPKKLQRSIWNQLQALPSTRPSGVQQLTLSLRNISLSPPPSSSSFSSASSHLPSRILTAIQTQCQLYSRMILTLDLSYSVLDPPTLACLCSLCPSLESLTAASCGLEDTQPHTRWPVHLKTVDFSRNRLCKIPPGFSSLLHLQRLNLSGNCINHLDPTLLRIPHLEKLYLLNNPIRNLPKAICRSTVQEMRKFLQVQPLLAPPSCDPDTTPSTRALSRVSHCSLRCSLLQMRMESFESGYNSGAHLPSTSSCSSLESEEGKAGVDSAPSPTWPKFSPSFLPHGYTEHYSSHNKLCQVFLPPGAPGCVVVEEVKDLSLHPTLPNNHLLITAVIRVSPHGMTFSTDKPAILVLSHCTRPSAACEERVAVLCSNTSHGQQLQWRQMHEDTPCAMYEKCVVFPTTHFSLFAVALVMPYHSASLIIDCNEGGKLTVPECPGFEVTVPAGSLPPGGEQTITGTVYYTDPPTPHCPEGLEENLSLASPVVGLEPHGIEFTQPVMVSLPVPDFVAITSAVHGASLQLWTASPSHGALQWHRVDGVDLSLEPSDGGTHTASFLVSHFSFFELLWEVCRDTLVRLGYGASLVYGSLRARYVAVRCQVFMTPPLQDLTFALLVVVYKFGEQLRQLGNYPWLLADSGERHVFLQTGDLVAQLDGCFEPRRECGESSLSQTQSLSFSGQDFSLRFAFALKLSSLQLPLQDYQVIGKLRMRRQNGATAMELNLIKVCI